MRHFILLLAACGAPPSSSAPAPSTTTTSAAALTINGATPKSNELARMVQATGVTPNPGAYWYDARSGLAGRAGSHAQWFVGPGYDFGPLRADASAGNTGIFYNERELPMTEALFLAWLFDIPAANIPLFAGHYRLDATGDVSWLDSGQGAVWLGNLLVQAQSKSAKRANSDGPWSTSGGSAGNSSGGCTYVSIPAADGANFTSADSGCG